VYNILGREIRELCGQTCDPGPHSVVFDPGPLPEVQDIYSLTADPFLASGKMVLQE